MRRCGDGKAHDCASVVMVTTMTERKRKKKSKIWIRVNNGVTVRLRVII